MPAEQVERVAQPVAPRPRAPRAPARRGRGAATARRRRRARRGRRAACARPPGRAGTSGPRRRAPTRAASAISSSKSTPAAATSRSQRSEPAADSITPIACQRPGTAWQKAWTRACASAAKPSSAANTTPDVPEHDRDAGPGAVDARRRARPPPGRRRRRRPGRPSACPTTAGDSSAGGSHAVELERVEHRVAPRARAATSNSSVPDASVTSVALLAASAAAARSPWAAARARCARTASGSCARSHSSFGAVKPVSARLPVSAISASRPTRSSISSHSARRALVVPEDRRADHAVGRVERDEPVHLARQPDAGGRAGRRAPPSTRLRRRATSRSGSCSAQPGPRRVEAGSRLGARQGPSPSSASASPLTAVVPTSSPTTPSVTRPSAAYTSS